MYQYLSRRRATSLGIIKYCMSDFKRKFENIWGSNPKCLLEKYSFQSTLTTHLDSLDSSKLNREKLYEIVLWKLNRFPKIDDALIEDLRSLSSLSNGEHRNSKIVLMRLLVCKGVALPMASTIFRFCNPNVFQIIDDRVYRVLFPTERKYPAKPVKITNQYTESSVNVYFNYLDKLLEICDASLPFKDADRILYQLDIELGNKIGDKNT